MLNHELEVNPEARNVNVMALYSIRLDMFFSYMSTAEACDGRSKYQASSARSNLSSSLCS